LCCCFAGCFAAIAFSETGKEEEEEEEEEEEAGEEALALLLPFLGVVVFLRVGGTFFLLPSPSFPALVAAESTLKALILRSVCLLLLVLPVLVVVEIRAPPLPTTATPLFCRPTIRKARDGTGDRRSSKVPVNWGMGGEEG